MAAFNTFMRKYFYFFRLFVRSFLAGGASRTAGHDHAANAAWGRKIPYRPAMVDPAVRPLDSTLDLTVDSTLDSLLDFFSTRLWTPDTEGDFWDSLMFSVFARTRRKRSAWSMGASGAHRPNASFFEQISQFRGLIPS